VAIDGPDAAGKTTIADQLARELERLGRSVIRASLDGFHNPRHVRYRRGALSPDGYYLDSFDLSAVRINLLEPLGPGGSLRFRTAVFDHRTDHPIDTPFQRAAPDAVLLFDGIFLMRPELDDGWDYRIFVDVSPETSLRRGLSRDRSWMGPESSQRYRQRYLPAQAIYVREVNPAAKADARVMNDGPIVLERAD
jgi:uridine kinase